MADSSFWRDLADQFRALPLECKILCADRYPVDDITNELAHWQLSGTDTAKALVDALARRAASGLPNPLTSDLLEAWLEGLVKRGGVRFNQETITTGNNPDGTPRPKQTIGRLYKLPEHSANYCKKLESEALQAEADERRRADPKNWPPFRAEFEAFKKLRELRSGPHEEIPEAFIRDSISRRLGIKPEQVTIAQIRHEVTSLFPHYPAITMIPSAPTTGLGPTASAPVSSDAPRGNVSEEKRRRKPRRTHEETVGEQIQRLRKDCNWSVEKLAEEVNLDLRTVTRHLSGTMTPQLRNVGAYERVFSDALGRKVVINKTP